MGPSPIDNQARWKMKKGFEILKVLLLSACLSLMGFCDDGPGDDDGNQKVCCLCNCHGHADHPECLVTDTILLGERDDCDIACEEDMCGSPCWVADAKIENCN
jgi:hypothetical protein